MSANTFAKTRNLSPFYTVRAVAGLGLVLMITFAGSASAQDLELGFAAGMGGTGFDKGIHIAVDASGNVYTTGYFEGTVDFDPGPGTANLTSAGGSLDIFVSKLDSAGNFVWAKAVGGGTNFDRGFAVAVDTSGNVYASGIFQGTVDFDPGPGTTNLTSVGENDIFVCKLDTVGNFVWAKAMGGADRDWGFGIAVDTSGNVYTSGIFQGTVDFDPGPDTADLTSAGFSDVFVQKLDTAGNFVWAKAMGGAESDGGGAITVDSSGNVYTTGSFRLTVDFDPGAGTAILTSAGENDIFVSKLDTAGDFVWAKAMGGASPEGSSAITVDGSGNVYTTGSFSGMADFDPGTGTAILDSGAGFWDFDIFVSKLDSAGNFVWAKAMKGTQVEEGLGIAVDGSGNVYTTGRFGGFLDVGLGGGTVDLDPGAATANFTSAGNFDIFVSELDSDGNFVWAQAMGGTDDDFGGGIEVDSSGNVYTTGTFQGTVDFDPGAGTANLTSAGSEDIFVSKLAVVAVGSSSNGDCFIATAAYGTPMAEEVGALRGVRDVYLLTNVFGTAFTDTYYRVSPPIADIVRESPGLRAIVRAVLAPIVFLCRLLLAAPFLTSLLGTVLAALILHGIGKRLRFARLKKF